jgi:hypothetical protein
MVQWLAATDADQSTFGNKLVMEGLSVISLLGLSSL